MTAAVQQAFPSGSLRDPAGRLVDVGGRILRTVHHDWVPHLESTLGSRTVQAFIESGRFVRSTVLPAEAAQDLGRAYPEFQRLAAAPEVGMVLEHQRIPFQSFALEWPAEMLHAAARLTLDLAQALLPGALGLKDATPYNVLFDGPRPVFVDVLSVERREPADAVWLAYGQFVRTFLLPLLAWQQLQLSPSDVMVGRRDGLEPEEVYRWLRPLQRLRATPLELVTLPTWLGKGNGRQRGAAAGGDPEKSAYVLERLLRRLQRATASLAPPEKRKSRWSDYASELPSYSAEDQAAKMEFVGQAMARYRPQRVLDVGCNTGEFSCLAARDGASVVAIDADPVVAGALWRRAAAANLPILPLVVNIARPTPAMGWCNAETPSFLDRARGAFDAVLLLAVIHHVQVGEGIPLPEILRLAAELTTGICVAEYIGPGDPMFQKISRGRDHLYSGLSPSAFEECCRPHFEIAACQPLGNPQRRLYMLVRRG